MIPSTEPPAIIVTGRALPSFAAERLRAVTVIDQKALQSSPSNSLDQIVRGAAGVQLFRRSDVRSSQPTSGGVTLRSLGGNAASRATVSLDGVPQADPFGGWVAWSAFDAASLGEVRVVRGAGLVGEGPGAIAGAIELTSALADGMNADVATGSRQAAEGRALVGGELGGGRLSFGVAGAGGAGFVPVTADRRGIVDRPAPYESASARLRWVAPVAVDTELQLGASAFTDARDRGVEFTDNRTRGADASLRLVGRGQWGWTLLGYGQVRRFRSSFAAVSADRSVVRQTSLQHDVPGSGLGWSAELRPPTGLAAVRLGADGRSVTGRSEEFASYVAGAPTRERVTGGSSSTVGLFVEAVGKHKRLEWSAAARLDRWRINPDNLLETILATGAVAVDQPFASRSGTQPTGRLALGASLGQGLSLRSAIYAGWRLPTLNELFRPFRVGADAVGANPALKPERVRGIEAGVNWRRSGVDLSATAFVNHLIDPVVNVTLGSGPGVFPQVGFVAAGGVYRQRRNAGSLNVTGVEAQGIIRRGEWTARASSAWSHARMSASDLAGLRPAQSPNFSAVASLGWSRSAKEFRVDLRYSGAQYEDDQNRLRLPSATTLDTFASLPLDSGAALTFRTENLFNANVVAGLTSDGVRERATPRTVWLGLRFRSTTP